MSVLEGFTDLGLHHFTICNLIFNIKLEIVEHHEYTRINLNITDII